MGRSGGGGKVGAGFGGNGGIANTGADRGDDAGVELGKGVGIDIIAGDVDGACPAINAVGKSAKPISTMRVRGAGAFIDRD